MPPEMKCYLNGRRRRGEGEASKQFFLRPPGNEIRRRAKEEEKSFLCEAAGEGLESKLLRKPFVSSVSCRFSSLLVLKGIK